MSHENASGHVHVLPINFTIVFQIRLLIKKKASPKAHHITLFQAFICSSSIRSSIHPPITLTNCHHLEILKTSHVENKLRTSGEKVLEISSTCCLAPGQVSLSQSSARHVNSLETFERFLLSLFNPSFLRTSIIIILHIYPSFTDSPFIHSFFRSFVRLFVRSLVH